MNQEPVLLVFENETISEHHLAALIKRSQVVILLSDAHPVSDMSLILFNTLKDLVNPQRFSGPIGDSRYLFKLRDFYFSKLVAVDNFEILIYGGRSSQVMSQYYIFKKLVNSKSMLYVFSSQPEGGIVGFHNVLSDEAFDGHAHEFKADSDKFGFDVMAECNNA